MKLVAALLLTVALAGTASALPLPVASVEEMMVYGPSVAPHMCSEAGVVIADFERDGKSYRLVSMPSTMRFVLIAFEDDRAWFGNLDGNASFQSELDMPLAQAQVAFPSPCDYLEKGKAAMPAA
jgi:hypothetical protein